MFGAWATAKVVKGDGEEMTLNALIEQKAADTSYVIDEQAIKAIAAQTIDEKVKAGSFNTAQTKQHADEIAQLRTELDQLKQSYAEQSKAVQDLTANLNETAQAVAGIKGEPKKMDRQGDGKDPIVADAQTELLELDAHEMQYVNARQLPASEKQKLIKEMREKKTAIFKNAR